MKDLVVVGTGLFAEVARDYFHEFSDYRVVAFSCHARYKSADTYSGLPVIELERLAEVHTASQVELFVAIGYRRMNKLRQSVYESLKAEGYRFASFVAPGVRTWASNMFGENVFIFENNVIQPSVQIGNNTILWSGNHIGHHSTIGSHCFVSSHVVISGSCRIGDNCFLGVNATLYDGVTIGSECLIGAGAIISGDAKDRAVYVAASTKAFPKTSDQIEF
jgi:sugar O-acyltransferase (sialic acid O-acetyltransferase NeuD family)